ncbi:MAG TPA: hypothetical protein VF788_09325 [Pseudonocardiaceae bacterium]
MTIRSSRPGIFAAATALAGSLVSPGRTGRSTTSIAEGVQEFPPHRMVSAREVALDDGFRDLLADALIARHRAKIGDQPELMFIRSTWDADEWARAEADQLLAHIDAVMERRSY